MPSTPVLPVWVGVSLTHAALQAVCEGAGVRALHIKGPALTGDLSVAADGAPARQSVDADLWVGPADAARLRVALVEQGWTLYSDFSEGSSFEHAATMMHSWLAPVDLHRIYPGVRAEPQAAFDALWASRHTASIAGRPCWVPTDAAQRLILLINAARDGLVRRRDIDMAWDQASDSQREDVRAWAKVLDAEVALAAATGELEQYRHRREYRLWRELASGRRSLLGLWWGRVRAEPSLGAAVSRAVRLALPNPGRAAVVLGRRAKTWDLTAIALGRFRQLGHEFAATVRPRHDTAPPPMTSLTTTRLPPARLTADERNQPAGAASFHVPDGLANVTFEPRPGVVEAFLMQLPSGRPLALTGTTALIWALAADGAADVVAAVASAVGLPQDAVREDTLRTLERLCGEGLLARASDS